MATLSALKKCETARKYAVFAYIRQQNNLLSLPTIPKVIDYLCLAYYAPDLFSKKNLNLNDIEMSIDQTTITYIKRDFDEYRTIYGTNWIDSLSNGTHKWTINLNKYNGWISIGIASKDEYMNINFSNKLDAPNYALTMEKSYYRIERNGFGSEQCLRWRSESETESGSAQVMMELNMEKGQLCFRFGHHLDSIKVQKQRNLKYKLAICLEGRGDSITLTKHSVTC